MARLLPGNVQRDILYQLLRPPKTAGLVALPLPEQREYLRVMGRMDAPSNVA
jgi:hypothetical protein